MSTSASYSRLDRLLHRIAFATSHLQMAVADLESLSFKAPLAQASARRPVFITALPRAGTTLLLEILATLPEFNSHTYRDLPFVLCPLFWRQLSRPFWKTAPPRERSHGDGMMITYDSPEAVEEIIWKLFWPAHYDKEGISVWTADEIDEEFQSFYRNHIRKRSIIENQGQAQRYLAKNNANVARLELLLRLFSDARIVIPLRDPYAHIGSLAAQHQHFSQVHQHDRFALRYMEWLGHHEFGGALKPIDFDHWLTGVSAKPAELGFWVEYWLAYARHLQNTKSSRLHFFDYEAACQGDGEPLDRLAEYLELSEAEPLRQAGDRFRTSHQYDLGDKISEPLRRKIDAAYDALRARAQ
ncbi:MAG: sulfotransferase [Pseudomonadota bacterium]